MRMVNEYFEKMHEEITRLAVEKKALEDKKETIIEKFGWDSQELKDWYQEAEEYKKNYPYSQGAGKAYRIWYWNDVKKNEDFIMDDFFFKKEEAQDFVRTLREAGIQEFIVTDHSTALMENIHWYIACGCELVGTYTFEEKDFFGTKTTLGLKFRV